MSAGRCCELPLAAKEPELEAFRRDAMDGWGMSDEMMLVVGKEDSGLIKSLNKEAGPDVNALLDNQNDVGCFLLVVKTWIL